MMVPIPASCQPAASGGRHLVQSTPPYWQAAASTGRVLYPPPVQRLVDARAGPPVYTAADGFTGSARGARPPGLVALVQVEGSTMTNRRALWIHELLALEPGRRRS